MRSLLLIPILFLLACCRHHSIQPTTAMANPVQHSTCIIIPDSLSQDIRIHLLDGETNEDIPFAVIILRDSTGKNIAGVQTDLEGRAHFNEVPASKFNLRTSYIGYTPFEVQNILIPPGKGFRVEIKLITDHSNDTIWYEPWPPEYPVRDPFSPQNRTIEHEDIRHMPKPR